MRAWLSSLPFVVLLAGIGALAMYVPAFHAAALRDWHSARAYLYSATIFLALIAMVGAATANHKPRKEARNYLLALLAAFTLLPAMLAVPFQESSGVAFVSAYFEMVSSLTTTGATLFDNPEALSGSDHLWRALVGWLGGFLVWVAAVAIFAPLNLGGFEVMGPSAVTGYVAGTSQISRVADTPLRLRRHAVALAPIYGGLTLILAIALLSFGDTALVATCHAMSVMATSGISPIGGTSYATSGLGGEAMILLFMVFALSRQTFASDAPEVARGGYLSDPEMRLGIFIGLSVPAFLFLRHWLGAVVSEADRSGAEALTALWGGVFTVFSFLTTTGFESSAWATSRDWSGLETPGLVLIGLALFGGGVATTAGGVKLLRVYALYMHGRRELERLVHPSSVGGGGGRNRYLRKQGAQIAWIFFMLFALSISVIMSALALTGIDLEPAVVLTIAALSNTGPLAEVAGGLGYADLSDLAKTILAASMVLGRLETLAIIALMNPEFWRR